MTDKFIMRPHGAGVFDTGQDRCRRQTVIIRSMQTLRHARFLARLVLAWFVLALGVAVASPLVKPQAMELVCSSAGSVKLVKTGDDGSQPSSHVLDCPLCLIASAPPPAMVSLPQAAPLQAATLWAGIAAHLASRAAAPLPPRGPPSRA